MKNRQFYDFFFEWNYSNQFFFEIINGNEIYSCMILGYCTRGARAYSQYCEAGNNYFSYSENKMIKCVYNPIQTAILKSICKNIKNDNMEFII